LAGNFGLTSSTLTATTLAGVAIVIAIGECAQFIVVGPIVADLAPPHLLGRYMSLYGLTFMAGVALGPAVDVSGVPVQAAPGPTWWTSRCGTPRLCASYAASSAGGPCRLPGLTVRRAGPPAAAHLT